MIDLKKDPMAGEDLQSLDEMIAEAEENGLEGLDELSSAANEDDAPNGPDLEFLIQERDQLRDKLMRSLADSENLRKRSQRERIEAEAYGGTKLARDLLSVYDNLSRALETVDDAQKEVAKALIEGLEITKREIVSTFAKHNIRPVAPEIGDVFDPQLHQAMFEAPLPETKAGEIIQVLSAGFTIGERLLRPAQVGVSSNTGQA
jgi:molecular chaperone GrpE